MTEKFPDLLVTRMDAAKEVEIETRSPEGKVNHVTIWIVVVDGESNWVEGLQLMAIYLILAAAFYFVPA